MYRIEARYRARAGTSKWMRYSVTASDYDQAFWEVRELIWTHSGIHQGLINRMAKRTLRVGVFLANNVTINATEDTP